MKKLLLLGLAATAMLASCSNDETVEMAQPAAIGFSSAFVNNGTRSINDPSLTTENLEDFAVYGFTQNGQIFDNVKVTKGEDSKWTYSPVQYWVADNIYTFGAIAPANAAPVSGTKLDGDKVHMTVDFTNDGNTDLLHAAPAQITNVTAGYSSPVQMTFFHQLAKVKFSFANNVGEGYKVKVTHVKITDAKKTGTLTVAAGDNVWSAQTGTLVLSFGNAVAQDATADEAAADEAAAIEYSREAESCKEQLMIPTESNAEYTVTFTAELFKGDVSLGSFEHTATIKDVELKLGYCYDFKALLTNENINPDETLHPIEFTLDKVENWNEAEQEHDLK